jgi:hypothetical protein
VAAKKIRVPKQVQEPVEVEEFEDDELEEGEEEVIETDAYIPGPDIGDRYVSRKIHGLYDLELLTFALDNAMNVLLMGDTGAGKTMLGEAYASKAEMLYYSLPCDVSIDPSALFGKIVPTEDGEFEWVDGPVTQLVRYGGVLNISEINFMPPRIAAALYPLLDSRRYLPLLGHRGEVIRPHGPNCWCELDEDECKAQWLLVIADMNPQYRGTQDLNAAFKNRFPIKVPWGYDKKVEGTLIGNPALLRFADQLRGKVGSELRTPVATNMLIEFEKFESALGLDFASSNFLAAFEEVERGAVEQVYKVHAGNIQQHYDDERAKRDAADAKNRMRGSASKEGREEEFEDEEFTFEMEAN